MSESLDEEYENRWSLNEEMEKPFKTTLQLGFPDLSKEDKEDPCLLTVAKKELGDYECHNAMSLCLNNPPESMLLKDTAEAIKNNLPPNDMIEDCCIQSIGFLTFRLSTRWIAKSVHKMLNEGIQTWALKLPMKSAVVNVSSRNIAEEMNVGHLRAAIIGNMLARMLDFSSVHVELTNHLDCNQFGMLIESVHENLCKGQNIEVFSKESKKRFDEDAEFRERANRAQLSLQIGDTYFLNAWKHIRYMDLRCFETVYARLGIHIEELDYYNFYSYYGETLRLLRREEGMVEENEGDEVILVKEKKTLRHHIYERKTKPLTVVKNNGVYDHALVDLSTLRYQLKEQKAEWIVFVADVEKREYFEMCFSAARRAGWLPTDEDEYPKTTFVGYGLVQSDDLNRLGKLVDLIEDVKTRCKAALLERVKANELTAQELENTAEELALGAIKYALMKDYRVFNYTLNVDEMLNDKGNTGVHLLYTHAQICSIINKSGKDIEELKMTKELTLEKDEERELGLHILHFTEYLELSCQTVFPSVLCAFLYELSERFTRFYSAVCQDVRGENGEANILLVCEATRVVMTKCFYLLGITPIDKLSVSDKNITIPPLVEGDDDVMESSSYDENKEEIVSTCSSNVEDIVSSGSGEEKIPAKRFKFSDSTLEEEQRNLSPSREPVTSSDDSTLEEEKNMKPPLEPITSLENSTMEEEKVMSAPLEPITSSEDSTVEEKKEPIPRFQLFSVRVHVDVYDCDRKPCFLFGSITVSDLFVSSKENGYLSPLEPDIGYTELFDFEWYEAVPVVNNDYINTLTHPKTQRSIPFTDFLDISANLFMLSKDDNILFQISNGYTCLRLSDITYDKLATLGFHGPDGLVDLVYYVLSDPVDAALEMTLTDYDVSKKPLSVKIFAYYGGDRKDSYYLTLLEDGCVSLSDDKKIPLNTSVMAVPANGSLVIDVLIKDTNGNVIVKEIFEFSAQRQGSNSSRSEGAGGGCIFKLNVNWR